MSVVSFLKLIPVTLNPARLWNSLYATRSSSADEEYFVKLAMQRRSEANTNIVIRMAIVYDLVMPLVILSLAQVKWKQPIIAFHMIHMLLMLPMFIRHSTISPIIKKVGLKYVMPISIIAPVIFYAWVVVYHRIDSIVDARFFILVTHIYSLCNFIIIIHPGSQLVRVLTVAVLSIVSGLAFSRHELTALLAGTNTVSMTIALFVTFQIDRQNRDLAQKEFQLMIQAAPAKIVRQSALDNDDLGHVFAPTHRYCICISSDWRGYQELSSKVASSELSKAIGAYYEMTDAILASVFPEGNYYTDWIADELFVVIFAKDESEDGGLINAGLRFACELLLKKQQFVRDINLPINIDVGVASGLALIGMMGPAGHRKATALGDVPGQARRYQEVGKQIRRKHGEKDRILFGYNSLLQITEPFDVKQFELEAGGKVRDVAEDRVFFMEPGTDQTQVAA